MLVCCHHSQPKLVPRDSSDCYSPLKLTTRSTPSRVDVILWQLAHVPLVITIPFFDSVCIKFLTQLFCEKQNKSRKNKSHLVILKCDFGSGGDFSVSSYAWFFSKKAKTSFKTHFGLDQRPRFFTNFTNFSNWSTHYIPPCALWEIEMVRGTGGKVNVWL